MLTFYTASTCNGPFRMVAVTGASNNTKKDIDETLKWTLLRTRIFMAMKLSEHRQKPKI